MNINHTFGTYIKDKRLAKQISLRKFAELLDISPVYLCNIEKDRNPAPKDDIISNMARLLMLNDTETAELYLNIKEVIGMLFIEQVYEKSNIKSDYVRCPSCKRGRLCDKPIGEKATVIALKSGHSERTSSRIILKCPKCSQKFIIHLSKEN